MAEEHHFPGQSPSEVFEALVRAIEMYEKVGAIDQSKRAVDFTTRTSGFSWGSRWRIEVRSVGDGSVAFATMLTAGSMVAALTEGKRIRKLWDFAHVRSGDAVAIGAAAPALEPSRAAFEAASTSGLPVFLASKFDPILAALSDAEAAAEVGDIESEERAIQTGVRLASAYGPLLKWFDEELRRRMIERRIRPDVDLLGRVGADLLIMSDRMVHGEVVYTLDGHIRASVEVDGHVVQTSRPTLTRMAIGSVLPGSALLVGLAVPKRTTKDFRSAHFVVVHPSWRVVEPIDPAAAHDVAGIVAQLNVIAKELEHGSDPSGSRKARATTPDLSEELARLGNLHAQGVLTEHEFAQAKARVLGS